MKVTITIEDNEDGSASAHATYSPELPRDPSQLKITAAFQIAHVAMKAISDLNEQSNGTDPNS